MPNLLSLSVSGRESSGNQSESPETITHSPQARHQSEQQTFSLPIDFLPLGQETRTHVSTKVMCVHLDRKEQTARGWACHEDGPLRPIRVHMKLMWPVSEIKRLLGMEAA